MDLHGFAQIRMNLCSDVSITQLLSTSRRLSLLCCMFDIDFDELMCTCTSFCFIVYVSLESMGPGGSTGRRM